MVLYLNNDKVVDCGFGCLIFYYIFYVCENYIIMKLIEKKFFFMRLFSKLK